MFNYPKWKISLIGAIVALGVFFCIPNFLPRAQQEKLPEWWQPMTLGRFRAPESAKGFLIKYIANRRDSSILCQLKPFLINGVLVPC